MTRIILHIGPGKCGSSSIQSALTAEGSAYARQTAILPQPLIRQIDTPDLEPALEDQVGALVRDVMAGSGLAILSHEVLFNRVDALANLARVSTALADEVRIVGYSRRQSDFLGSAYGQWHFRSPERTREVGEALTSAGLDPLLFSGLERFHIAAVLTEMATARQLNGAAILHWGPRYEGLARRAADLGASVSVGHIPGPAHPFPLVDDFYRRAGLEPTPAGEGGERIVNGRFDPGLIEAINLGVMDGVTLPGPHAHNDFLAAFPVDPVASDPEEAGFLDDLRAYVDTVFWPENQAFSRRFGLDEDYFRPRRLLSRPEIDAIVGEQARARQVDAGRAARHRDRTASVRVKALYDAYLATGIVAV